MKFNMVTFLWKEYYIDFLWATQVTALSYFQKEGYLKYENGALSAYATVKELESCERESKRVLLEPDRIKVIHDEITHLLQEIRSSEKLFASFVDISNLDLLSRYQMLFKWMRRFTSLYRYSEAHYVVVLEKILEKSIEKNFSTQDVDELKIRLLSDEYLLTIPKGTQEIISIINRLSQDRFEYKKIDRCINEYSEQLLTETARRFPIAVSQISHLSFEELSELLNESTLPELHHANQRNHGFTLKVHGSLYEDISTNSHEVLKFQKLLPKASKILIGRVAYPGEIKGKVKIARDLNTAEDYQEFIQEFQEGDILVAPMTVPDLAPLFSLSSAVITDEGGVTSHAALLAREYKTPCIVGTYHATSILKDGDIVLFSSENKTITKC